MNQKPLRVVHFSGEYDHSSKAVLKRSRLKDGGANPEQWNLESDSKLSV